MYSMRFVLAVVLLLSGTGCNQDKTAQLEKENKEMRAQLEQPKQLVDLDTQAKCATAAKEFFKEEFSFDQDTITLHQHNHYNKLLGKCFVLVEWHYRDRYSKTGSWYNVIKLHDVYQHDEYGGLSEYTEGSLTSDSVKKIYACRVSGSDCTSITQFNERASKFMDE
jgi:glucose-6-phosphate 1-dehydrogenase